MWEIPFGGQAVQPCTQQQHSHGTLPAPGHNAAVSLWVAQFIRVHNCLLQGVDLQKQECTAVFAQGSSCPQHSKQMRAHTNTQFIEEFWVNLVHQDGLHELRANKIPSKTQVHFSFQCESWSCLYRATTEIGVLTGLAPSDSSGDGCTSVKARNVQLCTTLNERRPFI